MDTSTGRFISQDSYAGSTADPVSLHKYLYANSNPVMYSDPSGYTSLAEQQTAMIGLGILAVGFLAYDQAMLNIGMSILNDLKSSINTGINNISNQLRDLANNISASDAVQEIRRLIDRIMSTPLGEPDGINIETFPSSNPTGINVETFPSSAPSGIGVETFPSPNPEKPFVETFPLPIPLLPYVIMENNNRMTTKQATLAAAELGYVKVQGCFVNGQAVFYNKKNKTFISPDVDSHNGGVWKMADSIAELGRKNTRSGTYDKDLNRIGD